MDRLNRRFFLSIVSHCYGLLGRNAGLCGNNVSSAPKEKPSSISETR